MLLLNDSPSQFKHTIPLTFLNHTYMLLGPASVVQIKVTLSPLLWIVFIGDVDTIPSGETVQNKKDVNFTYLSLYS